MSNLLLVYFNQILHRFNVNLFKNNNIFLSGLLGFHSVSHLIKYKQNTDVNCN